jgi:signal transduction histidine kinase
MDKDKIFPFNFVISKDLTITSVGPSLKAIVTEGTPFQSSFEYVRPKFSLTYDFESILQFIDQVFIIKLTTQKHAVKLKGQFTIENVNETSSLLFLGSPWLFSAEDINNNNWKVSDFALHDTTLDIIQMISDLQMINEDLTNTLSLLEKNNSDLVRKNSRLDSLVYSLTHDFRAPILNCLGLLDISEIDFEEIKPDIKYSLSKLDETIINIAQISRLDRFEVKKEEINIDALINQAIVLHKNIANRNINFIYNNTGPSIIFSEIIRLNSIINNLISNSIRYSDPKKDITIVEVNVSTSGSKIIFEFIDNGIGIDQSKIANIFKPFYRATNLREGTGLGLYIVELAVESLNGKISVNSIIGVGTTFLVEI